MYACEFVYVLAIASERKKINSTYQFKINIEQNQNAHLIILRTGFIRMQLIKYRNLVKWFTFVINVHAFDLCVCFSVSVESLFSRFVWCVSSMTGEQTELALSLIRLQSVCLLFAKLSNKRLLSMLQMRALFFFIIFLFARLYFQISFFYFAFDDKFFFLVLFSFVCAWAYHVAEQCSYRLFS